MRTTTILSLAVGAIALTLSAAVPRANAMMSTVPAAIDAVAPNDSQVQKVRRVCRQYRYWHRGRWHYRTRCYNTRSRHDYRRYSPPPHRSYAPPPWWLYR
jgi:hypothetical protein